MMAAVLLLLASVYMMTELDFVVLRVVWKGYWVFRGVKTFSRATCLLLFTLHQLTGDACHWLLMLHNFLHVESRFIFIIIVSLFLFFNAAGMSWMI